jgi:hypothetical protein
MSNEFTEPTEIGSEDWVKWVKSKVMNLEEELRCSKDELTKANKENGKLHEQINAAETWIKLRLTNSLQVIEIGTQVRIVDPDIIAKVESIHVDRAGVSYNVSYWKDGCKYTITQVCSGDIERADYLPYRSHSPENYYGS